MEPQRNPWRSHFGSAWPTIKAMERGYKCQVCVGDIAAKNALMNKISLHQSRLENSSWCQVHVTGHPQYDNLGEFRQDWDKKRLVIRRHFNLGHRPFFILIAGQLNGTSEAMQIVEEAVRDAGFGTRPCNVLVKPHPRATALDEIMYSNHWRYRERERLSHLKYIEPSQLNSIRINRLEDFLPAVDAVVSGYATIIRYAALLVPNLEPRTEPSEVRG